MKYRKKAIIVEAKQYFPDREVPGVFVHQPPDVVIGGRGQVSKQFPQDPYPAVMTIQGQIVRISAGEWVITESDGVHHYPCSADVFAATYEEVT